VPVAPSGDRRLAAAYRRTGADLPFGDPRPTHGAEMEGWFWRFTDASTGRAVIALCGVNRAAGGDWATVAVALHPGGRTWSVAAPGARAWADRFLVEVEGVLRADAQSLQVQLPGVRLDADLHDRRDWVGAPLHGGGVFSVVPGLGQYWHPHVLGGASDVEVTVDGAGALDGSPTAEDATAGAGGAEPERRVERFERAATYAEKNWGAGFPDRWWWGQAHDFEGLTPRGGASVAFGGGALAAGPVTASVTGAVLRLGDRILRFSPPGALVGARATLDGWMLDARTPTRRLRIRGWGTTTPPHVLPVPLPAERRDIDADLEHLAGHLELELVERGRAPLRLRSELAGLEVGSVTHPPPLPPT
jgi:tocopherol cyclase